MADLTVNSVRPTTTTRSKIVTFGATITAGQALYLDVSDSEYKLADANSTEIIAGSNDIVIALTAGADGEQGLVAFGGLVVVMCTPDLAEGIIYLLSDTPGGIKPGSDQLSADNCTVIGVGAAGEELDLTPLYASGQTVA